MFCTYLTLYRGDKFPPFYIGSSSVQRITEKGYFGSVSSLMYKDLWKTELKNNPDFFNIIILSKYKTREEALTEELRLHIKYDVAKNPLFVNRAVARIKGFYGIGRPHTEEAKRKISERAKGRVSPNKGKTISAEQKAKISATKMGVPSTKRGIPVSAEQKLKQSIAMSGRTLPPRSAEHCYNIAQSRLGKKFPRAPKALN